MTVNYYTVGKFPVLKMEYPWVVTGILGFWGVVPTQSILDFKECWQDTGHQISVAKKIVVSVASRWHKLDSWNLEEIAHPNKRTKEKSLTIAIHLHCLIPKKWGNLMTPANPNQNFAQVACSCGFNDQSLTKFRVPHRGECST